MQIIANGLVTGATVALLALAFQLVYLPTKAFHMALAAVYYRGAAVDLAVPSAGTALVSVGHSRPGGRRAFFRRHRHLQPHAPGTRRASYVAHLLSSLGIYIATIQLIIILWGNESEGRCGRTHGLLRIPGVLLPMSHLVGGLAAVAALALFFIWLRFTDIGLTFRALADNAKEVALRGYNVNRLRLMAFGISGLLGGLAALLEAQQIGFTPSVVWMRWSLPSRRPLLAGGPRSWGGHRGIPDRPGACRGGLGPDAAMAGRHHLHLSYRLPVGAAPRHHCATRPRGGGSMMYPLHLLIYFDIYVIVALSLNIVVGYCGIITLAHASFFAVGAYAFALATTVLGLGFLPALIVAAAVAAVLRSAAIVSGLAIARRFLRPVLAGRPDDVIQRALQLVVARRRGGQLGAT